MSNDKNGPDAPDHAAEPTEGTGAVGTGQGTGTAGSSRGSGAAGSSRESGAAQEAGSPEGEGAATAGSPWQNIEVLEAEKADLRERFLRAMAEMENLRKRTEREKADTARYAISDFARDVLTIGDNIQRAIDAVPVEATEKDPALRSFLEGVELMERELLTVLERHGVTRLDPKGKTLDPNRHQAMFEIENTRVPAKTIVEVMQAGYMIGDRLLRPALVAVSKGGPRAVKPPEGDSAGVKEKADPSGPGDPTAKAKAKVDPPSEPAESTDPGTTKPSDTATNTAPDIATKAANDDRSAPAPKPPDKDAAADAPKTRRIKIKTAEPDKAAEPEKAAPPEKTGPPEKTAT